MLEFDQAITASNERLQALEANHVHALTDKDQRHTLVITGAMASKPYQHSPHQHIYPVLKSAYINAHLFLLFSIANGGA